MRITNLVTKGRMLFLKEMYGDQSVEFECGSWDNSCNSLPENCCLDVKIGI